MKLCHRSVIDLVVALCKGNICPSFPVRKVKSWNWGLGLEANLAVSFEGTFIHVVIHGELKVGVCSQGNKRTHFIMLQITKCRNCAYVSSSLDIIIHQQKGSMLHVWIKICQ